MTQDSIKPGLHVLVDDTRSFYVDVTLRTADDARKFFAQPQPVAHLYMDHDLGCVDRHGNDDTGYNVLTWLLENGQRPEQVTLVTMNPVGRDRMAAALEAHGYVPERPGALTFQRSEQ